MKVMDIESPCILVKKPLSYIAVLWPTWCNLSWILTYKTCSIVKKATNCITFNWCALVNRCKVCQRIKKLTQIWWKHLLFKYQQQQQQHKHLPLILRNHPKNYYIISCICFLHLDGMPVAKVSMEELCAENHPFFNSSSGLPIAYFGSIWVKVSQYWPIMSLWLARIT